MTEQERKIMWALLDSLSIQAQCIAWLANPNESERASMLWQMEHQQERMMKLFKEWNLTIADHNGVPVHRETQEDTEARRIPPPSEKQDTIRKS